MPASSEQPKVAILAPIRGRARIPAFERMTTSMYENSTFLNAVITYADLDDPDLDEIEQQCDYEWLVTGDRIRLAQSWSKLAYVAEHLDFEYVFFAADDITFSPQWDEKLIGSLRSAGNVGWAYGFDGVHDASFGTRYPGQLELPCHALSTVATFRASNGFPEGLRHLFADNVMRDVGLGSNTLHFNPDVRIEHHHWSRKDNAVQLDPLYRQAAATFHEDQATYFHWRQWDMPAAIRGVNQLKNAA